MQVNKCKEVQIDTKVVAHANTVRAYHNIISPFICMRCH